MWRAVLIRVHKMFIHSIFFAKAACSTFLFLPNFLFILKAGSFQSLRGNLKSLTYVIWFFNFEYLLRCFVQFLLYYIFRIISVYTY